jgi:predicted kinase
MGTCPFVADWNHRPLRQRTSSVPAEVQQPGPARIRRLLGAYGSSESFDRTHPARQPEKRWATRCMAYRPRHSERVLVVISGLPGTGKSAVAAELAARLKAVLLSIDPIEDALLGEGLPRSRETGVAAYEAARVMAEQNLTLGRTVVVDAVNDSSQTRRTWRVASAESGARLAFVLLTLEDEAEHRLRLGERLRPLAHVPEPTWAQVRDRAAAYEPWVEEPCLRLNAADPVDRLVTEITNWLTST